MVGANIEVSGVREAVGMLEDLRVNWGEDAAWVVGVGAEYGAYVEFGTSRMQAQPYLFPAAAHVMRTQFASIQYSANSAEEVAMKLARAIEGEAKKRAPVDTGFLRSSIEAAPAGAF